MEILDDLTTTLPVDFESRQRWRSRRGARAFATTRGFVRREDIVVCRNEKMQT